MLSTLKQLRFFFFLEKKGKKNVCTNQMLLKEASDANNEGFLFIYLFFLNVLVSF